MISTQNPSALAGGAGDAATGLRLRQLDFRAVRGQSSPVTTDALKDTLRARPFRSFAIHLAGRKVEITHPEQLAFPNDGVSAIVLTPDGHIHILDVREINGLELRPARRAKAS